MKKIIFALLITVFAADAYAQNPSKKSSSNLIFNKVVEIACGECQFKMVQPNASGKKTCDLAVKIDGNTYFVDGKSIDDFGDAHGEHGFCNAISKAEITGEIVNNRFKASSIKLLPKKL